MGEAGEGARGSGHLREALKLVAVLLKETGVPFALAGSYGLWARGGPEPDHDVDFMIAEEDAARVDGASERQLFAAITVPLAGAALSAGLVMSWARALGEFGATIMFAGNVARHTQTLPLLVYAEFGSGELETSVAAAAILVLAAFGVLLAVRLRHWGRVLDLRTTG